MPRISPLTKASLQHGPRRYVTVAIAIVLGVAFLAATFTLSASLNRSIESGTRAQMQPYSAAVHAGTGTLDEKARQRVSQTKGVQGVDPEISAPIQATHGGTREPIALGRTMPASGTTVLSGSGRPGSGQVVLDRSAAASLKAGQGDSVTLQSASGRAVPRTVAGIVEAPSGTQALPTVYASGPDVLAASGSSSYDALLVRGRDDVAGRLSSELGSGYTVRSQAAEVQARVKKEVSGLGMITGFLTAFALIALVVAGLVISNTFQILLAQRTRELALMRCVGAGRRQVRRAVTVEALVLGVVASTIGLAIGTLGVRGVVTMFEGSSSMPLEGAFPSAGLLALPVVLGVAVTVLAARRPARRASGVAPLAALRPAPAAADGLRGQRGRLAAASVLGVTGAAALAAGAWLGSAAAGVLGGLATFLAVVLAAPVLLPGLVRLVGRIGAPVLGVTGRLAVENSVRSPRRTAATGTALLVGITLVSTMVVGAATGQKAVSAAIDKQMPIDVVVSSRSIDEKTQRRLSGLDGVTGSTTVRTAEVTLTHGGQRTTQQAAGMPAAAQDVVRQKDVVDAVRPGTVLLDIPTSHRLGVENGGAVTVGGRQLRALVKPSAPGPVTLSGSDLQAAAPKAATSQVWLRLSDGADADRVNEQLSQVRSNSPGLKVAGAFSLRQEMQKLVDIMLAVVTGLLGVAVLIALVGVANTLGLSVLERTRETAVLRALGLTRRRLRRMIGTEALLISLVATVLGVALGTLYGWAGVHSLLGSYADGALPVVPPARVGLVVLVAGVAALLASVIPARRAARSAPVEALGAE